MSGLRADKKSLFICLALALVTLGLYWPVTHHPFLLFDDEEYVTLNKHVTTGLSWANFIWAFDGAHAANWHPLTWLSHQLDCTLFGVNAGRHHLVNLLFHIANTLLVFLFLRGLTGAVWRSAVVAALFAWHPLHVESVAWISERKDMLSTFFWLLTLMAYVRFVMLSNAQSPKSKIFYALSLLLFAGGLMSKPMVVTLPFVLLLLDFWPLGRLKVKGVLLEKIPFFALAAADSAVTYLVQNNAGAVWQTSLVDRLANVALAYDRYIIKTVCPTDLAIVYSHPKHTPTLLALGAIVLLVLWTIPILQNWRRHPFLAFGWGWFLGTLVPTIGIVQVGAQSMADRYTYIPSIGLFIVLVWGWAEFCANKPRGNVLCLICAGGALIVCLVTTSVQIFLWRSSIDLFSHTLAVTENNYVVANLLGKAHEKNGQTHSARLYYVASVRMQPRFPQSQFNLAMSQFAAGAVAEGLPHLEAAAEMKRKDPQIQSDLGLIFAQHASWTNAVLCFSNSVALRPASAETQFNYAVALVNLGRFAEAVPHYVAALRLKPDFETARDQLTRLVAEHPELLKTKL